MPPRSFSRNSFLASLSACEAQVRPFVFVDDIAWVDPPDPLPTNVTHGTLWNAKA
ncbi:MAG: hypothetical protein VYB16_05750 [Gemmatimonadota bacterium]|nr:hypothetical protein [Gemmatimonadota bacterium]